VEIQPGRPLVFGRCQSTWFFGLPGNPLSTMVCFELFARPAITQLSGAEAPPLLFPRARLGSPVRVRPGLTRFLPAVLGGVGDDPTVELSGWQGSGDVSALVRSNCFVVVPSDCPEMNVGEWIGVLPLER
jgi:molybdopterin molybdotransferase